jgi:hypothetical protein
MRLRVLQIAVIAEPLTINLLFSDVTYLISKMLEYIVHVGPTNAMAICRQLACDTWFMADDKRILLRHFLAALAYRTQKALRAAPPEFSEFRAPLLVRTPHQLIRHMDDVLGYARTFFIGGTYRAPQLADFAAAVAHFHETLADVARHLELGTEFQGITAETMLQGPLSDAMTHVGQLAMLRRLAGSPVPPENFVFAAISPANLGVDQPLPVKPDKNWPERL